MSSIRRTEAETGQMATDSLAISLRAFVTDPNAKPQRPSNWKPAGPSRWILVFDTETRTDESQQLTFGSYRFFVDHVADGRVVAEGSGLSAFKGGLQVTAPLEQRILGR